MRAETQEVLQPHDQALAYFEPIPAYPDESSSGYFHYHTNTFPPIAFPPTASTPAAFPPIAFQLPTYAPPAVGSNPAGYLIPPDAHGQPISTQVATMGAPGIGIPLSSFNPGPPTHPHRTPQHKFTCSFCMKMFNRPSRADACFNAHLGWKPYVCPGTCGNLLWSVNTSDNVMVRSWSNTHHQHCSICQYRQPPSSPSCPGSTQGALSLLVRISPFAGLPPNLS